MLAFVELLAGGGLLKNIKVYRAEGVTLLRCEAMPAEGHSGLLAAFSDIQWAEGLIDRTRSVVAHVWPLIRYCRGWRLKGLQNNRMLTAVTV